MGFVKLRDWSGWTWLSPVPSMVDAGGCRRGLGSSPLPVPWERARWARKGVTAEMLQAAEAAQGFVEDLQKRSERSFVKLFATQRVKMQKLFLQA